jgi:hypothetical protein
VIMCVSRCVIFSGVSVTVWLFIKRHDFLGADFFGCLVEFFYVGGELG